MKFRYVLSWVFLALLTGSAAAQVLTLEPNTPGNQSVPAISFDLLFPAAQPAHYVITVESSGRAAYQSDSQAATDDAKASQGTPYTQHFLMTEATRARIFALARQVNYFKGNFDYTKHPVADTGTKTLTYTEGQPDSTASPTGGRLQSTSYNYSENAAIQQLTAIFQGVAGSAELAGRLDHLRRFDRLGLDAELKRAEEMAQDGQLLELQVAASALRAVADDPATMNLARQRAQHLLRIAQSQPSR